MGGRRGQKGEPGGVRGARWGGAATLCLEGQQEGQTASAAHSKLGPSGLLCLVARGLLWVSEPPSGEGMVVGGGGRLAEGWPPADHFLRED